MNATRQPAIYLRKSKRLEDSAAAQLVAVQALATRDGEESLLKMCGRPSNP